MCSQPVANMNHGHQRLRHVMETNRVIRRKFMKHMVEKRRRNRINDCLDNMRSLVLNAMGKNPSNYTKMEKADILEMTVKFVQSLKKKDLRSTGGSNKASSSSSPPEPTTNDFVKGFEACRSEITSFLEMAAFPAEVKSRLSHHLEVKAAATSPKSHQQHQQPARPKVVSPHEFTALHPHSNPHEIMSHFNQQLQQQQQHYQGYYGQLSSAASPLVLPPTAHHPHYLQQQSQRAHAPLQVSPCIPSNYPYPSAGVSDRVLAIAPSAHQYQPLSIDIKPEPVSHHSHSAPARAPAPQPDVDSDIWRPF